MSTDNAGTPAPADAASPSPSSANISANLQDVRDRIQAACQRCHRQADSVRLVAVSKTKPVELLREAYDAGQRVFGENYVQELIEKVPQLPDDVTWHFIGPLQSNKASKLVQAFEPDQLHRLVIETISSEKLATKLNNAVAGLPHQDDERPLLNVMVQVNTSGEESKSGVEPEEVSDLCRFIVSNCPKLKLCGVMTIGAEDDLSCFDTLVRCRDQVVEELQSADGSAATHTSSLGVSMGMSGDFEEAIERGATSVRVGSTIFGQRNYAT
jgi:PLP dependent protein